MTFDQAVQTAATGYTSRQKSKALAAIAAKAVIPTTVTGLATVLSASSAASYLADQFGNCNCAAGLKSAKCWHGLATRLLATLSPADLDAYTRATTGQSAAVVLRRAIRPTSAGDRHGPRPDPLTWRAPRDLRAWIEAESEQTGESVGSLLTQAVRLLMADRTTTQPTGEGNANNE